MSHILQVNGAVIRRVSYHGVSGKHALRQQARRRRRNTSIAAGNSPPITRVTMKTVAATSPNPASHAVQPANTTTTTTTTTPTPTTITASITTPTTSSVIVTNNSTTTCLSTTTVASLLPHLPEACTSSNSATSPSPPICRLSNKMTHSPNQLSGTRLSSKTCVSSTFHPILGTRVSSRIANNAATSGLSHLNSGASYMTNLTQSGAFSNIASGQGKLCLCYV